MFLPHCPKELYESLLTHNFTPSLGGTASRLLLGNGLAEYVPGVDPLPAYSSEPSSTPESGATPAAIGEEEFVKPKKKRKGKGTSERPIPDGVLRRLGEQLLSKARMSGLSRAVPHLEHIPLSSMPETNLPGFARAFLSTSFQWLNPERVNEVDWDTPLPSVEFGENSGVF